LALNNNHSLTHSQFDSLWSDWTGARTYDLAPSRKTR